MSATRTRRLGDWGRVNSLSKDRKRLPKALKFVVSVLSSVTKRQAADSKSRHYVSAQYQTTFDKRLFFRLAAKFLLFGPNNLILQSITLFFFNFCDFIIADMTTAIWSTCLLIALLHLHTKNYS